MRGEMLASGVRRGSTLSAALGPAGAAFGRAGAAAGSDGAAAGSDGASGRVGADCGATRDGGAGRDVAGEAEEIGAAALGPAAGGFGVGAG
ncbi:MAG: hypothetical protein AAF192_22330 [Pseudomonadota bacterium]